LLLGVDVFAADAADFSPLHPLLFLQDTMRQLFLSGSRRHALAASFVCAVVSSAAHAGPVNLTLTGWAFGEGNNVSLSNSANSTSYSGSAGAFKGTLSGSGVADSNFFTTYCIELEQSFRFGPTVMNGYSLVDGASYFGQRRDNSAIADKLGRLMTYVAADPTRVDTAIESTSLQLAVWNLVYDNDFSLSTGKFRDASVYATQATQLLAGASNTVTSKFDVFALSNNASQDFLLLAAKTTPVVTTHGGDDEHPPQKAVPEPGTIALSGLALLVMGAGSVLRRRKARA
jgi:PEP-CTERM motif